MSIKGLLCAIPIAMVLVGLGAGVVIGIQKKHDCEARGGTLIHAVFSSECVALERR
jgi:hypothetical protein